MSPSRHIHRRWRPPSTGRRVPTSGCPHGATLELSLCQACKVDARERRRSVYESRVRRQLRTIGCQARIWWLPNRRPSTDDRSIDDGAGRPVSKRQDARTSFLLRMNGLSGSRPSGERKRKMKEKREHRGGGQWKEGGVNDPKYEIEGDTDGDDKKRRTPHIFTYKGRLCSCLLGLCTSPVAVTLGF